ncbi:MULTISPECIES: GNAT family N-acetyltransferase [Streptomyces]|uniref:GNAT family N-acetyltransferase n=1 Tax=Streptomyces TaxID=1883 RepID=UPI000AA91407|nr:MULTISPECIES: GNAT family N-acetyltransferase [Streptomyces]MDX2920623.1 GNAT family N-acetyltransferase [Streptomyces sp. NE06-03C]MDX3606610.1 GNAT family N-acetyltransferase [Streptomyces sp. FL06-04B]MDX3739473.1 GNAT family N-acetyltransferase [Streptomyces sp. ID01-15D]
MEPVIRPAAPADLGAVAEIYTHYVHHTVVTFEENPPPVAAWRRRLDDLAAQNLPFLVAEVAGEVVGYAYAAPWRPKPAYRNTVENSIYLAPGRTGRGLGGALLKALLTACAGTHVRQMIAVIADAGTDTSAALHRRLGFTDAGRLAAVGHKHGRWIDTLLMQRAVGDPTTDAADLNR